MNIDQFLNVGQQSDVAVETSKNSALSTAASGSDAFRQSLRQAADGKQAHDGVSQDGARAAASSQLKKMTPDDAPPEKLEDLEADLDSPADAPLTQAQLAWLLAQLAGVANTNGPALPIDGQGQGLEIHVHDTAITDLSRLVSARALVGTAIGTTGTPNPQSTDEVAASNMEAQGFSNLFAQATVETLGATATAPTVTDLGDTEGVLPPPVNSAAVAFNQSGTELLNKPLTTDTPVRQDSHPLTPPDVTPKAVETTVPDASLRDADGPTPAESEFAALENQAGRNVIVRPQTPAPRPVKQEGVLIAGEKVGGGATHTTDQLLVAQTGEGQAGLFEDENQDAALAKCMDHMTEGAPESHRSQADGSNVSPFSLPQQEAEARGAATAAKAQPAAVVPLENTQDQAKTGGPQTIRFEVSPPDMGRVQVRVSVSDHAVYTNVLTDQSAARDLLLKQQDRLQDALGAYGLGVGSFNVEVGGQGQQRGEFGPQPDLRMLAKLAADVPNADQQVTVASGWDDRGLNLFA